MITGRWGKPTEVRLDITVDPGGTVRGVVNPGRQDAVIREGRFDPATGELRLEGEHLRVDGTAIPFHIHGRLEGRALHVAFEFGAMRGEDTLVRVEDWRAPRMTLRDRLQDHLADLQRWYFSRGRPTGRANARRLRERGEPLDSITMREAVAADIPALAALHVELWNRTYRTTRGPTVATRMWQWNQVFAAERRRDFVLLLLEDRRGRLIGFVFGRLSDGEFDAELSKIYLRWEYHGLGLGRRMMHEVARRFAAMGARSFVLRAERSNPTIGFYDRMGGERLTDDKERFTGAYAWRDVRAIKSP